MNIYKLPPLIERIILRCTAGFCLKQLMIFLYAKGRAQKEKYHFAISTISYSYHNQLLSLNLPLKN